MKAILKRKGTNNMSTEQHTPHRHHQHHHHKKKSEHNHHDRNYLPMPKEKRIHPGKKQRGKEIVNMPDVKYNLAEKIYFTMSEPHYSRLSRMMSFVILTAILVSTIFFVLESEPDFKVWPSGCEFMVNVTMVTQKESEGFDLEQCKPINDYFFEPVEISCMAIFTLEYLLRVFTVGFCRNHTSVEEMNGRPEKRIFWKRLWAFLTDGMNIVDLIAIVPFYVTAALNTSSSFAVIRTIRLARVFRVFKLSKYSEMSLLVLRVLQKSTEALSMLMFVSLLAMIVFGSMVYFAEQGTWHPPSPEYPEFPMGVWLRPNVAHSELEISPFSTISSSFWWALVTCTTVGYGDYVPTSVEGKMVGVLAMMAGLLLIALPVTIIGANFAADYKGGNMQKEMIFLNDSDSESSSEDEEEFNEKPEHSTHAGALVEPGTERTSNEMVGGTFNKRMLPLTMSGTPGPRTLMKAVSEKTLHNGMPRRKSTVQKQAKVEQGMELLKTIQLLQENKTLKQHVGEVLMEEVLKMGSIVDYSPTQMQESVNLAITLVSHATNDTQIPLDKSIAFKLEGMLLQLFASACLVEARRLRRKTKLKEANNMVMQKLHNTRGISNLRDVANAAQDPFSTVDLLSVKGEGTLRAGEPTTTPPVNSLTSVVPT